MKIFRGPDGIHGESTERLSVPFSYSTWPALMRHTATPILIYAHMQAVNMVKGGCLLYLYVIYDSLNE